METTIFTGELLNIRWIKGWSSPHQAQKKVDEKRKAERQVRGLVWRVRNLLRGSSWEHLMGSHTTFMFRGYNLQSPILLSLKPPFFIIFHGLLGSKGPHYINGLKGLRLVQGLDWTGVNHCTVLLKYLDSLRCITPKDSAGRLWIGMNLQKQTMRCTKQCLFGSFVRSY